MRDREPVVTISNTAPFQSTSMKSNVGPIVGGVIGGLIGLGLLVFIAIFYWRRQRNKSGEITEKITTEPDAFVSHDFPYEDLREQPTTALATRRPSRGFDLLSPPRSYPPAKGRQTAVPITPNQALSTSPTSAYASVDPPSSDIGPVSLHSGITASAVSSTEVRGLQEEVANLRCAIRSYYQYDDLPGKLARGCL
jgi:hypothetical protein